jgi:hypothetical protein
MENKSMKLADWARKQGIAYLTAYRWFKDGKLPVKAYQSESGTIIVEDDDTSEQVMQNTLSTSAQPNSDIFSLILRKVVEFSKNSATVEDFAAYILSNFSLKLNSGTDSPRYSKNKPKSEDIQKHFQQFIPKGEKPKPNMFVTEAARLDELVEQDEHKSVSDARNLTSVVPSMSELSKSVAQDSGLYKELIDVFSKTSNAVPLATTSSSLFNGENTGGMVSRMKLTPQTYTSSTEPAFSRLSFSEQPDLAVEDSSFSITDVSEISDCDYAPSATTNIVVAGPTGAFKPTQKEMELAKQTFKSAEAPRRRGRKPSAKNLGKK